MLAMMPKVDHFTPLSRAVASFDRDSYAARFAVYDREHKALLRRLATSDSPYSDADVAREEQAFREAIRRIEFAEADDRPALVPQTETVDEAPPPAANWPEPPPPRRESLHSAILPDHDQFDPGIAIDPIIQLSAPRSVARRVGERLTLAVVALALAGGWIWMGGGRQETVEPSSLRGAVEASEPAAPDNATDAKSQQPTWLSPEIFYAPPPMPSLPLPPRADVPLPTPRPER
jgi:hypothetical protein